MGWLWSSSKPSPAEDQATFPQANLQPQAETPDSSRRRTRDEAAERELHALLAEFDETSKAPTLPEALPHQQQTSQSLLATEGLSNKIDPYPSTMSCVTAFDAAWFCQLPGGQFVHVYRYGNLRNCSEAWSRFWFCMRTNRGFMTDEARRERVRDYYREREKRLLEGPNSEQVWEARKTRHPFPIGQAHQKPE